MKMSYRAMFVDRPGPRLALSNPLGRILQLPGLLLALGLAAAMLSRAALAEDEAPPVAAPNAREAREPEFKPVLPDIFRSRPPRRITIGGAWQGQGPGLSLNGQAEHLPDNNPVCGAINILAPHPTSADILFAGSVNGGIWRTTNATAVNPTWTPLTDQFISPSIGDLEYDPTDGAHQTLVAGIGDFSSFGVGGDLVGLLRSTDGGNTWVHLGETDLSNLRIHAVAPRGTTILAGTSGGMYRSTDDGVSFQNISGVNGLGNGIVFDLAGDPSDNQRIYAAVGSSTGGVFRTDDAGAHWTDVTDATIDGLVTGSTSNMQIVVSAAAGNAAFVGIVNSGRLAGVLRSTNQGGSWTAMDLPQTLEGGTVTVGIHPGGQGRIHFSMVADPTDGDIVYVGGDRQPTNPGPDGILGNNDDTFPNSIGARDFSGRLFRGDASVAPTGTVPSPQWTPLTHSGTASNSAPHADSRDMDFDANGNIVESNDGGIYRRTNPRTSTGDWSSVIGTLQVAQFHDIAYDPNFDIVFGGTQDTGCPIQNAPGSTTWTELATADGGDVAIDATSAPGQSTLYWSTQNLGGFRRKTCTGANVCGAVTNIALNVLGGGNAIGRQFVTPVTLNSEDPTRLIIGGSNSVYESSDQGNNVTELNSPGVNSNGMVYGHPSNADLIVIGSGSQVFVRTTAGGALVATAANPPVGGGTVTDEAVDPADANAIFITSQTRVARTSDGGAHWTDITGNLAAMSGGSLETIVYIEGTTNDILVVGAKHGAFASFAPFCGCWFALGTDLPNTFVWELDYDPGHDLLVAGTQGRSAWTLGGVAGLSAPADAAPVVALSASGGDVDENCVFLAPYSATITDDCSVDATSILVTATSLDGLSTVGTPTVSVTVVSATEVHVSGNVSVSALTGCPARVRITVSAADLCGQTGSSSSDIEVNDRIAPSITVQLNRNALWPPNHKLADIQAHVTVDDNCPNTTWVLESITSDEPDDDLGDGHTSPDIVGAAIGTPDTLFQLRSERSGNGDGRDYTIVYQVQDACGNTSQNTTHVLVPHDQSGHAIALTGLTSDGRAIDPGAPSVTLAIPGVLLHYDGRSIVASQVLVGNTNGVVAPEKDQSVDLTGDGVLDFVASFPAEPLRRLLRRDPEETLGLHFVTRRGDSYLVPDILAGGATDLVETSGRIPSTFLGVAAPNPSTSEATIAFGLEHPMEVRLSVYDVAGREVRRLANGKFVAGGHAQQWDGRDEQGRGVAAGLYIFKLVAGDKTFTQKVVFAR